jgi:glycine oxidase
MKYASTDFQIIGGGINGLLLTLELARSGASVTLIERDSPGREASWAGGGIVSPLYPWRYAPSITALASWAQDYYPELVAELTANTGIDSELSESGLLMLDAEDQDEALQWAASHQREMHCLAGHQIYNRESGLASGFQNGLWMPKVANVRNPRLLQALLAQVQHFPDVTLLENSEVLGLESEGALVRQIRMRGGCDKMPFTIPARQVVVCAGAWSGRILSESGRSLDVHPVKGQMLLYKFSKPPLSSIILTAGRYLIPRCDGHVLVGSTLEHEGFDKTPSAEARLSLQRSAEAMFPELHGMEPVGHWAGLRPGTRDGVPYIGKLPDWQNLFVNAGQFRNGLVLAPASARLMADLLLVREPIVDPLPYDPARQ